MINSRALLPCLVPSLLTIMDQISIKTPNPKCRLYWCLIEFIDWWRNSQSCWYFRPLLWTSAPLTFSLVDLHRIPMWISTAGMCVQGEGIRLCGEHLQELYTVYLTRFRTKKNCFTNPNKNLGGRGTQTDKHQPPSPFTGQLVRIDNI